MSALLTLVKGFTGKPSHAPLTDVSIGAYTVGVLMLIAGYCGLEQEAMSQGALLAISGGLIVAIPTALTGLLDWADISRGTRARTLANYHLMVMLTATVAFAATWVLQRPGYLDHTVTIGGLIAGCVALGLLTLGGTLGGALAYVYGVRVVKQDVSLADALIPGRLEATGGRTDFTDRSAATKTPAAAPAPPAAAAIAPPVASAPAPATQQYAAPPASPKGPASFEEAVAAYQAIVAAERAGR